MTRHRCRTPVFAAVLLMSLGSGNAAHAKRTWSFSPDSGFIDDPMTFDANGARFAFVHTDSARFLHLRVIDVRARKELAKVEVADPRRVPKRLAFDADGSRLLLVWMDGSSGAHGATLYELSTGKRLAEVGRAQRAGVARWEGQLVLVLGEVREQKKGGRRVTVTAHRISDLKRIKSGSINVQADGTLRKPDLRLLYWEPAHLTLVGMRRGAYDRKRDIRLPDEAVRYDVLSRKVLWTHVPQELLPWTTAINMRPKHGHQYRFLQVSDDLKTLHYVDRSNAMAAVQTAVNWRLYEPKSLRQSEAADGDRLYFSMTIDPVNPQAVARKKADVERCDIYRLDAGPRAVLLGQVPTDKRKFSWTVGADHFAYLRKLKGFGRGGKTLELWPISK